MGGNDEELMKILLHEMQHGVQHIEGFGRGGSPTQFASKMTRDAIEANPDKAAEILDAKGPIWKKIADKATGMYKGLPGEVESRTVEDRASWLPEMLRKISPRKLAETMGYGPENIYLP
jgi:formyltetrahydrofolate synthetase